MNKYLHIFYIKSNICHYIMSLQVNLKKFNEIQKLKSSENL